MSTLQKWTRPSNYIGAEWQGWYVFLSRNRDSSILENCNFNAALELLRPLATEIESGDCDCQGVQVVSENHWAFGWVEWIAIHESNTEALREAEAILKQLEDYPSLNDEALSTMEWEAFIESWANYGHREFIRALERAELTEKEACDECSKEATREAYCLLRPSGEYYAPEGDGVRLFINHAVDHAKRNGGLSAEVCNLLNLESGVEA